MLSGLLIIPGFSFAADLSDAQSRSGNLIAKKHEETQLPRGHRYIEGTVEEVNENTIRVDAGGAGEMSPRYLNLENVKGNEEAIKAGDRLQIEVNAQNKVVKYKKVMESQK
jgi:ribosomal protein S1